MKKRYLTGAAPGLALGLAVLALAGCGAQAKSDPAAEVPPPAEVISEGDPNILKVDHPEQFPTVAATKFSAAGVLNATGVVSADVSRNIPVVSLAAGRVVEIHARLGDAVQKGQLLMRVQSSDLSAAFAAYRTDVASETLARTQLARAKLLYDKGALAQKDLEIAQDTVERARITLENDAEHIRILGADPGSPTSVLDIFAPASGVITEQNATASAVLKTVDNSPNLFTISDLSNIWVLCDVFENDLKDIRLGETAEVRLNAYPDRVFTGKISDIGPILDPVTRTAKVRLEMANPEVGQMGRIMRLGMFVTAAFHSAAGQAHAQVPATAVLHLHDRDWVYSPAGEKTFRRREVVGGRMLPSNMQEIVSGLEPGTPVVSNALLLQNTAE